MPQASITVHKKITLNVPRLALWSFLSDTDRLNKAVGLPVINFTPYDEKERKGYYKAKARILGVPVSYEELPYQWVEGKYYTVVRVFPFPFLRKIGVTYTFQSVGEGTELRLEIEVGPKNLFTTILTKGILSRLAFKDVFALSKEFEQAYRAPSRSPSASYETMYATNKEILEQRFDDLRLFTLDETLIPMLRSHLLKGSDIDVVRMRPFELADRWNVDRYETLKVFIAATKAGMLDLHWTVLCPNCRGISGDTLSLAELKSQTHCDTCGIDYNSDFASCIEARFTVHPSVRLARHETYCIGGPANMPHIVTQVRLAPYESRHETLFLTPGSIRIRTFQTDELYRLNVTEESAETTITAQCKDKALSVQETSVRSGEVTLRFENATEHEILAIIERESWRDTAATAAIVTSLQDYRDLFPSEAVAPGSELGIASIAVLFTDLKGSTALYKAIGDTKAFEFVQNHFRFLTESVANHHGGIVKTMGDAIMASFAISEDALVAAIEMQKEWDAFSTEYGMQSDLALKIGIYEGSAIVINNKGKLDYFGTTVNVAGRLQKFSRGGDIIISETMIPPERLKTLLAQIPQAQIEQFSAELKGLEQEHFRLLRIANPI